MHAPYSQAPLSLPFRNPAQTHGEAHAAGRQVKLTRRALLSSLLLPAECIGVVTLVEWILPTLPDSMWTEAHHLHAALLIGGLVLCVLWNLFASHHLLSNTPPAVDDAGTSAPLENASPAAADDRFQRLHAKLGRALQGGQLRMMYQPIFSADGRMVAVEALARWHDAEEGHVSPSEFIAVAESTDLIVPFSQWVLRQACSQMVLWRAGNGTLERVAVNVSARHVERDDFAMAVQQILSDVGLAPSSLELELTESALAGNFDQVRQNLDALRAIGVRISIDDFGTGYSCLGRVRDLQAHVLKIDRSFIHATRDARRGAAMVRAIIDMAHSLQLSVIAEGVETPEQLKMLRDMACDEIQGFLLACPQTPDEITARVATTAIVLPRYGERSLRLVPRIA